MDKNINEMIKIDFDKIEEDDSMVKYDSESKRLYIDTSKQKKYTVYLYLAGKSNEVFPEIMTEMELADLEQRIAYRMTNKRIQSKQLFIKE